MKGSKGRAPGGSFRPGLGASLATLFGLAVLIGLGVWQLQRLAWKTELIRTMTERMAAAPAALPETAELDLAPWLYRHVEATGLLAYDKTVLVAHGRGYDVLTPLLRLAAPPLLVLRGRVPEPEALPPRPEDPELWGRIRVTGILRPVRHGGLFTPRPKGDERVRLDEDPAVIAAAVEIPTPVPAVLIADEPIGPALAPAAPPRLPRNPHLGYALTWFALAVALLVIYLRHGLLNAGEKRR